MTQRLTRIAKAIRRANSVEVRSTSVEKTLEQAIQAWEERSGERAKVRNIINILRHEFTNYDASWRRLQHMYSGDPCGFLKAFHEVVFQAQQVLDQLIEKLYQGQSQLVSMLQRFNSKWVERKLLDNIIPPECEEDDVDTPY